MVTTGSDNPVEAFVVRLVAPFLRPRFVPMRSLTRTLDAVQRLMERTSDEEDEKERAAVRPGSDSIVSPDGATLHLVDIKSGSAVYKIAASDGDRVVQVLKLTGRFIAEPNTSEFDPDLLSSIEELSEVARSLACIIEFRQPGRDGAVLATVKPNTYHAIAASAFVSGETSAYGRIERVGGATELHCGMRFPEQSRKMVICRVANEDLVRRLGQYVYQHVVVSGTATWFRRSWRIRRFEIASFEPPKTGSIAKALENVHNAGGKAWDDVDDPDRLIREMRHQ